MQLSKLPRAPLADANSQLAMASEPVAGCTSPIGYYKASYT